MAQPLAIDVSRVRPAALAGRFYDAAPGRLAAQVEKSLAKATPFSGRPKAIITPHAGFIYSGDIAGSAYAALRARRAEIRRVVLLGPCHRVPVRRFAVPSYEAFATPLGLIPIDREGVAQTLSVPGVEQRDDTHDPEHSLETQLPFLQRLLGPFSIVPIIVGGASTAETDALLDALWGGAETLIVVSSDLSHFHPYEEAKRLDDDTCRKIESLAPESLGDEQACGRHGIKGLLARAQALDLRATTIDLRNSGDTAGRDRRDRVVGYAAITFEEAAIARLGDGDRQQLIKAAVHTLSAGLRRGEPPQVALDSFPRGLRAQRACFVTLKKDGRLRGCVGSLKPHRPLVSDVVASAFKAAFGDRRFAALSKDELKEFANGIEISISILSHPRLFPAASEKEALAGLKPGTDGLILRDGGNAALFLPQVWETVPNPEAFLSALRQKAGLSRDHWSDTLSLQTFTTETFGQTVPVKT